MTLSGSDMFSYWVRKNIINEFSCWKLMCGRHRTGFGEARVRAQNGRYAGRNKQIRHSEDTG